MAVRYDDARKRWVVEFEQRGIRVFQRLPKGCSRAQAETREGQLRREIYDREVLKKIPDLTLEDAIKQWLLEDHRRKSKRKAESEARQWESHVCGKLLRDVPEVAQTATASWRATANTSRSSGQMASVRRSGCASPATINRRLAMLKAVCRHAYKQGRIGDNLSGRITMLREDNKRERYLTSSDVQCLRKASSQPVGAAIMIAAYTGLRASELLALTSSSVQNGSLIISTSKTGKPRVVPVPGPALPYLRALPLECSYWELRKQFMAACKKAKLKNVRFHDLRHTCASWLINAGVDIYTLSKILGHSSIQTTQRYAHLYHDTLKDAMSRLK